MSGMWCFYPAPYKPCSEGKMVHFLPGSFLLLRALCSIIFLQKSVSALANGEAPQDRLGCMAAGPPRTWCSHCRGFAASRQHLSNAREQLECIRWRRLQNDVQFNHTQRNPSRVPQEGSGMQTEAQRVWRGWLTGRFAPEPALQIRPKRLW